MDKVTEAMRKLGSVVRQATHRPAPRRVSAVLGSLLVACAVVSASLTVEEILRKVHADQATYEGVRVMQFYGPQGCFSVRQKVWHAPGFRERFEVVSPRSMAGKLHVSDGKRAWRYDPQRREASEMPLPPQFRPPCGGRAAGSKKPFAGPGDVGKWWRQKGVASVAGRKCYVVEWVWPADKPTLTLYVDTEHFVILGLERRMPDGRMVETWKFEAIEFAERLDSKLFTFKPPEGTRIIGFGPPAEPIALSDVPGRLRMNPVVPGWLPAGYRLLQDRAAVVRKRGREALWLQFSNGADTFSIFQSLRLPPHKQAPPGAVRWDYGPYTLVVVSRLTARELEAMRKSLREWQGK